MKKALTILISLLFALTILTPGCTWLSACLGYRFILFYLPAFAVILALLSVCIVVLTFITKESFDKPVSQTLLVIIAPLSWLNVMSLLDTKQIWVAVIAFVYVGSCHYLSIKHGKPLALKILALVISAILALPICFFSFLSLAIGPFGENTVVQVVPSPNGEYYAEVIDSDQGALGGNTIVDVYTNNNINLGLFRIEQKPQQVYCGEWGEHLDMQIYWKEDDCLVIDGIEYGITHP